MHDGAYKESNKQTNKRRKNKTKQNNETKKNTKAQKPKNKELWLTRLTIGQNAVYGA